MTTYNEVEVLSHIQQLIDKHRCSIDGFFTDSKTAAGDILNYLQSQKIIMKKEVAVEIKFSERNKAA